MGEFFRGWRRKIGLVTLVMASVFVAGWVAMLDEAPDFPSLTLMLEAGEGNFIMRGQIWLAPFAPSINGDEFCWKIPIWSIAIPLTLISLWLLLFKCRNSTSKKTPELTANEGAES